MPKKGPKERGYGEACTVGSCFESSSTKWDLDFSESSPNGPKWTQKWLKAVSPKNSENGGTGGALRPKTLRKGSIAQPSPLPKRRPRETAGEEEGEARTVGGSPTPGGRKGHCVLHTAPRHALTPPRARRRSHLQNAHKLTGFGGEMGENKGEEERGRCSRSPRVAGLSTRRKGV